MAYRRSRRSYRRFFRSKRKSVSWTKETIQCVCNFSPTVSTGTNLPPFCVSQPIVSNTGGAGGLNSTNALALRTVKNFVLNGAFTYGTPKGKPQPALLSLDDGIDAQANVPDALTNTVIMNAPVSWALIYVPQGVTVPFLSNATFASLYEPNQNVIDSGVWQPTAGPLRIKSRMARKLHTGDSIYFCAYSWASEYATSAAPAEGTSNLLVTISFCTKCN